MASRIFASIVAFGKKVLENRIKIGASAGFIGGSVFSQYACMAEHRDRMLINKPLTFIEYGLVAPTIIISGGVIGGAIGAGFTAFLPIPLTCMAYGYYSQKNFREEYDD
jgi:hypothetical protein